MSPSSPFSWDNVPTTPPLPDGPPTPGSPPTQWLSAPDMKLFGAEPLKSSYAVVKCKDCGKPVLESAIGEHAGKCTYIWAIMIMETDTMTAVDNCAKIRAGGKKGAKGKAGADDDGRFERPALGF